MKKSIPCYRPHYRGVINLSVLIIHGGTMQLSNGNSINNSIYRDAMQIIGYKQFTRNAALAMTVLAMQTKQILSTFSIIQILNSA